MIEFVILLLAIPIGFLIAYYARDELIDGRMWFFVISVISLLLAFIFIDRSVIFFSLLFVFVLAVISYCKSFDKKWTK